MVKLRHFSVLEGAMPTQHAAELVLQDGRPLGRLEVTGEFVRLFYPDFIFPDSGVVLRLARDVLAQKLREIVRFPGTRILEVQPERGPFLNLAVRVRLTVHSKYNAVLFSLEYPVRGVESVIMVEMQALYAFLDIQ